MNPTVGSRRGRAVWTALALVQAFFLVAMLVTPAIAVAATPTGDQSAPVTTQPGDQSAPPVSPAPTDTATPAPTDTATPSPIDSASPSPDVSPSPSPVASPSPTDSATPAPSDSASPSPDVSPSPSPSPSPSTSPTVGPADATTSTIVASPATITTDGSSTISVTLKDASGNGLLAGGDAVTLASSLGTVGAVTDLGNGTYTVVFTSSLPGTATISATVDGTPIDNNAQVTVEVGASSPATSTITASPSSITTDGSATVTIAFKDAHGNPAPLNGAKFNLTSETGTLSPVTDNGDNSYSAVFTTDAAGTVTMSGTLDGVPLVSTATVVVGLPGVASAATSTISAVPASIAVGGSSTVTVTLKDAAGKALSAGGDVVVLSSDSGSLGAVTDNGDGTYSATFTSAVGGTATISGTVNGAAIASSATVVVDATRTYIATFAAGTSAADQVAAIAAVNATDVTSIPQLRMHVVDIASYPDAVALGANPAVSSLTLDQTRAAEAAPSDPSYADQWSLPKIGWDQVYGTVAPSGSAVVALLDTGVDASQPDLAGQLVPGTGIIDGSNSTVDPNGHGTAMAGIIAAVANNGTDIAGIGYAGVKVMPITVLDANGLGQDSDIIAGVVYAVDHGASVINMSFSNPGFSPALQAAIDYAWAHNVIVVAATGNDASGLPAFPAGDRGVIGVSNTDETDALNASSNYGADTFLAAPGTDIATLAAGGDTTSITGTSASSAEVAAAAALLRANDPSASNGVIVSRLARDADAAGTQGQTGNGRLNLERAIADASTGSVEPAGAAPVGGGGPFVGPSRRFRYLLRHCHAVSFPPGIRCSGGRHRPEHVGSGGWRRSSLLANVPDHRGGCCRRRCDLCDLHTHTKHLRVDASRIRCLHGQWRQADLDRCHMQWRHDWAYATYRWKRNPCRRRR